jgi:protein TonB
VSTSWQSLLAAWIQARRHYPAQARQRGVEGSVELRVVIAHDGHVLKAQVAQSSGSDLLDQAALAMFDGADAPPFPGEMAAPQITITLNIRYRLADR